MKKIPESIRKYLLERDEDVRVDGYLCLNQTHAILDSDGWVGMTDLGNIDRTSSPALSVPVLEGLLTGNAAATTVIKHAHVDQDYYFDIHLFPDNEGIWVVFIDKTRSAKLLQKEQQIRLNDEYKNDARPKGK